MLEMPPLGRMACVVELSGVRERDGSAVLPKGIQRGFNKEMLCF